ASALRFQQVDDELILAANLIYFQSSARQYRQSVLRLEFRKASVALKQRTLKLALPAFQRKIKVAACAGAAARDFARDPDVGEFGLQQVLHRVIEFGHAEYAPLRFPG